MCPSQELRRTIVKSMLASLAVITTLLLSPRYSRSKSLAWKAAACDVLVWNVAAFDVVRVPPRSMIRTIGSARERSMGLKTFTKTATVSKTTALGMVDNSIKYLLVPQLRNIPSYPSYQGDEASTIETTSTASNPDPVIRNPPLSSSSALKTGEMSEIFDSQPIEIRSELDTSLSSDIASPPSAADMVNSNALPGSTWDFVQSSGGSVIEPKPLFQVPELRVPQYQMPMPDLTLPPPPDYLAKLGFQFRPTPIETPELFQRLPILSQKLSKLQESMMEDVTTKWDSVSSGQWLRQTPSQFRLDVPPIVARLPELPKINIPALPTAGDAVRYLSSKIGTIGTFEFRDPLITPTYKNPLWANAPLFPTDRFLSSMASLREILETQSTPILLGAGASQETNWQSASSYYRSLWTALDLSHLGTWYFTGFFIIYLIFRHAGGAQNSELFPDNGVQRVESTTHVMVDDAVDSTSPILDSGVSLLVQTNQLEELKRATESIRNQLKELETEKISRDYEVATLKSELRQLKNSVVVSGRTEQQLSSKLQAAEGQVEWLLKEKGAMESDLESLKQQLDSRSSWQNPLPKILVEANAVTESESKPLVTSLSSSTVYRNNVEISDQGPLLVTAETAMTRNNSERPEGVSPSMTPKQETLPEEASTNIPLTPTAVPLSPTSKVAVTNFFSLVEEEPEEILTPATPVASSVRSSTKPSTKASKKSGAKVPVPTVDEGIEDWSTLSEAAIKRKTVKDLVSYLEAKGLATTDAQGKILKKSELVEAVISALA